MLLTDKEKGIINMLRIIYTCPHCLTCFTGFDAYSFGFECDEFFITCPECHTDIDG